MPELYQHQKDAVSFIKSNNGGFLAYDAGTGKTLSVLEAYRPLQAKGVKLMVFCPLNLISEAWEKDNAKFTGFKFCNMRLKPRPEADIYAINFEGVLSASKRAEIEVLCRRHRVIACVDESSRISNPQAKTTKYMLQLAPLFKARVCLSGTPCSQSATQWWSQIAFVKPGVLHGNFWEFRNTYFHLQRGSQKMPAGYVPRDILRNMLNKGWKWEISDSAREALMKRIGPVVRWKKLDDCIDMPPEVDQIRPVSIDGEQAVEYKRMKDECIAEIKGNMIPATIALTKLMKLRTITSGFAYCPDGALAKFDDNPKLMELKEVLDELGSEKVVIFCNFRAEAGDIKSILGDRCVVVDGETKDKTQAIEAFRSSRVQYLIANEASIAHGVTLIEARYMVFYSHSYSAEKFVQARARVRRIGQTGACVYIHLVCTGTIDEVILDVLQKKMDAAEIIRKLMDD